ncbi:hypothetical protein DFH27DRAFT_616677 [Peziza echinospora]|nr:hypothetical protein DFH27DRAFT_616677 [Peziza echinospora]
MAVWSYVVHNSTNTQVQVLGPGAIDSDGQVKLDDVANNLTNIDGGTVQPPRIK